MNYADLYRRDHKPAGKLQTKTRLRVKQVSVAQGMQKGLTEARLEYRAGKPSNYRTTLNQLGGTADAHYQNAYEFWKVREYIRDYDRNTPILGQAVDRALDQVLGTGLKVDPDTGDPEVNATLTKLWNDWSSDPEQCDFTWRQSLDEMERLALRHTFIDGDVFALLDDATGSIMMLEGDRVTSAGSEWTVASGSGEPVADLVHGVEIDGSGRPVAYWFSKMKVGERQRKRRLFPSTKDPEMVRATRDRVIHVYDPKRISQSRGISAFHAVFDRISMHEDIEFAQLVQQQVAACVAAFVTSEHNQQWGSRTTATGADGSTELLFDEFSPGMIARLNPGEKIDTFSPRNPTSDALQLAKQIVREIGLAIGLPLELALLVTSDTTFHGYRGVINAYKKTKARQQAWFSRRFRSRIYKWKVRQWVAQGLVPDSETVDAHVVRFPLSSYVDPLKDAQSDDLRQSSLLASPRQIAAERGRDYDQIVREIVKDRAAMIEAAMAEADALGITWQELLGKEPPMAAPQPDDVDESNSDQDDDVEKDDNANDE